MRFGQLTECSMINIFLQKLCRKWGRKTTLRPLFFFNFMWGKSKWSAAWLSYISIVLNLACNKNKLYKTLNCWFENALTFGFSEKGLELVSPPNFANDFWIKILDSNKWPPFIVWLLLLLEILGNMCIAIVCFPDRDVIDFQIGFIFLIKLFFYMTKELRQKSKNLENETSF